MASRSNKSVRYAQPTMVSSAPKMPNPRSSLVSSVKGSMLSNKPQTTGVARTVQPSIDRNGNRSQRATLGPADPATRRAALNAALQPGPAVKPAPAPVRAPNDTLGLGAGLNGKKRSQAIDDYTTRTAR